MFFPNGGVASITTVMKDGSMVEIATVGNEGMLGINVFFGGEMMAARAMMQVPDTSAEAHVSRDLQTRSSTGEARSLTACSSTRKGCHR